MYFPKDAQFIVRHTSGAELYRVPDGGFITIYPSGQLRHHKLSKALWWEQMNWEFDTNETLHHTATNGGYINVPLCQ
jgi:hypothetical protein